MATKHRQQNVPGQIVLAANGTFSLTNSSAALLSSALQQQHKEPITSYQSGLQNNPKEVVFVNAAKRLRLCGIEPPSLYTTILNTNTSDIFGPTFGNHLAGGENAFFSGQPHLMAAAASPVSHPHSHQLTFIDSTPHRINNSETSFGETVSCIANTN